MMPQASPITEDVYICLSVGRCQKPSHQALFTPAIQVADSVPCQESVGVK